MVLTACDTARLLAYETWSLLQFSYTRKRRSVDERGFTDRNLLTMEMLHPDQVWVNVFPQNREALTGADFEWWIGDGNTYLPMLVQAKRLGIKGNYAGLNKRIGRSPTLQINRLIQVCTKGRKGPGGNDYVGYLPAYIFYNTMTPAGLPSDRCCGHVSLTVDRGCTIAHAIDVKRSLQSKPKGGARSIQRIGRKARPWSCLFCCPCDETAGTAARAKALLEGEDRGGRWTRGQLYGVDQLPSYVFPALERGERFEDLETDRVPGARVVVVTSIPRSRHEREIQVTPDQ